MGVHSSLGNVPNSVVRLRRRSIHKLRDLPAGVNAYGRSPERGGQYPQITMTLDAAERLLAFEEAHGGPAQRHLGIPVARNAAGDAPYGAIRILDQISGGQTAHERRCELQPIDLPPERDGPRPRCHPDTRQAGPGPRNVGSPASEAPGRLPG